MSARSVVRTDAETRTTDFWLVLKILSSLEPRADGDGRRTVDARAEKVKEGKSELPRCCFCCPTRRKDGFGLPLGTQRSALFLSSSSLRNESSRFMAQGNFKLKKPQGLKKAKRGPRGDQQKLKKGSERPHSKHTHVASGHAHHARSRRSHHAGRSRHRAEGAPYSGAEGLRGTAGVLTPSVRAHAARLTLCCLCASQRITKAIGKRIEQTIAARGRPAVAQPSSIVRPQALMPRLCPQRRRRWLECRQGGRCGGQYDVWGARETEGGHQRHQGEEEESPLSSCGRMLNVVSRVASAAATRLWLFGAVYVWIVVPRTCGLW